MASSHADKLATTILTIAQLRFKQAIKKPENEDRLPPVSVEVSSQLFSNIDAVLQQNTHVHIQKCTEWIVKHVAPSKARIALLGDYLVSVSKYIGLDLSAPTAVKKSARNRMDLLLIVNDVLHADKYHPRNTMKQGIFGDVCGSFVAHLIENAAACITEKDTFQEKKLKAIINYWATNRLVSADCLKLCRERADESLLAAQGDTLARKRNYILPEYHGDRTAPWYELPASYMLDPMIKHPHRPINPSEIKIQKLDKKPVSPHVRKLLDGFFENIDLRYRPTGDNPTGETAKYKLSLDPMGQLVKQDKETGERVTVANGYGWSPKLCQSMQNHGVPENIKIAREDLNSWSTSHGKTVRHHELPSLDSDFRRGRQRDDHRRSRSWSRRGSDASFVSHDSDSRPRSRGMVHDRRGSDASYDSRRPSPRPRSSDMTQDRREVSPKPMHRGFSDRDQQNESWGSNQSRHHDRDRSQRESRWSGSDGQNRTTQGSPNNQQYQTWAIPQQNYPQSYSQPPQSSFNMPPFPPQQGQSPGQFSTSMPPFNILPPPPTLPHGVEPPPPPPPTNYNGIWPPPPPNMNVPANGPQYNSQYGNNNSAPWNQNQSGRQGGRGYGSPQRGGYSNNRGSWRGNGRGGRY